MNTLARKATAHWGKKVFGKKSQSKKGHAYKEKRINRPEDKPDCYLGGRRILPEGHIEKERI